MILIFFQKSKIGDPPHPRNIKLICDGLSVHNNYNLRAYKMNGGVIAKQVVKLVHVNSN